ncbi:MAG: bifunctional riboflavin kinase/FAD synthetase [Gammaproteobacteria bacterium]
MELIRGLANLEHRHRGCVATIGNYDGVHLGHQQVLKGLIAEARKRSLPAVAVIFEPTPQEYFAPAAPPARLMNFRERYQALVECSVDRLLCLHFNAALANMLAETFIEQVLISGLGVRYLVVGDDFRFGHERAGDFTMLAAAGAAYGFEVAKTPGLMLAGERISSTRIRECLAAGQMERAAQLLGLPFSLSGRVMPGEKLGRSLGFPTVNIPLKRRVSPVQGIFVAAVHGIGSSCHYGAAYVGRRPAVNGQQLLLEVFIFNFSGELYGQRLQVELLHQLRGEMAFGSLEALKAQMARDVAAARAWLKQQAMA